MHLFDIDDDLLEHVLLLFGRSPRAYLQRIKARSVCKLFRSMNSQLFSEDGKIHLSSWLAKPCRFKETLLSFDLDESKWVLSADLCRGFHGAFEVCKIPRKLRNPFTWKILFWSTSLKQWLQSDTLQPCVPKKLCAIPPSLLESVNILPTTSRGTETSDEHGWWKAFIVNVCRDIQSSTNRNIVALSMKETMSGTEEFNIVADALLYTNIRKLNLSGHMERRDLSKIFLNGYRLEHLNINYCMELSDIESAHLFHLLMTTQILHTLKMCFTSTTIGSCRDHDSLPIKISSMCKSLRKLCASLQQFSVQEMSYDSMRLENLSTLFLYSPFGMSFHTIEQACLPQRYFDADKMFPHMNNFLQSLLPSLYSRPHSKRKYSSKMTQRDKYDRRNQYRNQLLPSNKSCAYCGSLWRAGSIKIQTFEGLQSMCKLGKRRCSESIHYVA